ncbi:MAG TPA: signal peptide peptidase SppA [Vicinamibacteria bacterium]|nr:signal peptide peptidase SppA [Vicinamibacteria bacterium]
MSPRVSALVRLGRGIDVLRRLLVDVLFFGLLIGLAAAAWTARAKVPAGAALVVKPRGVIVEQLSTADPVERLVGQATGMGGQASETLLKDLLDAIRAAKDDGRIKALYLDLDDLSDAGLTKLRDLRRAIADFRKSGKKVIAYADGYLQPQYYLAAQADEVYVHPQGLVILEGYGRWRNFYREGLDRLGVEVHVFRVGEYKSAVEPYLRNDMSPEAKEMSRKLYGDLWRDWLADVAAARKLQPADITAFVESFPERLRAADGDLAKLALRSKLVDKLAPRDEVRKRLIDLVGEDKATKSFRQVDVETYLRAKGGDRQGATGKGKAVAVVVAKGTILDGTQPAGTVGGDSTARLLRQAREDESVKAVVLRVDSPGGSVLASEIIRRECELVRLAGKPLVVSMGSVAASGGYWISTASDEIWAAPETITGSIGIFGLFPTVDKPLARYLGVHTDGVGTTRFSDALRPDRPLDPAVADVFQQSIDHGYEEFLARVGEARKMTRDQVDRIARGRVWSGEDAKGLGLVDQLGGLDQAVESAARRARLEKGYRVLYVEREKSLRERLVSMLAAGALDALAAAGARSEPSAPASALSVAGRLRALQAEVEQLARWNDPHGVYAHCLCADE